jgi:long-chain acyl-CoA synthetase
MTNVASYLDSTALRCPDDIAVRFRGRSYSYARLQAMTNSIAAGLMDNGIGRGHRVALCSDIRPGFIAAFLGIIKTGAVHTGFDYIWPDRDFAQMIEDCGIDAILCSADHGKSALAERLQAAAQAAGRKVPIWVIPAEPDADTRIDGFRSVEEWYQASPWAVSVAPAGFDDVATIAFTSGTTGRRKAAQITHGNIVGMTVLTMPLVDLGACSRRLVPGNYEGILAQLFLLLLPVLLGNTIVLSETRDPAEVWQLVERERVTYMLEMPVFYHDLIARADLANLAEIRRHLRICITGGAAFPAAWHDEFRSLVGLPILPGYGATETTTCVSFSFERDGYVPGKVGRPIPGVRVRIVGDDGASLPAGEEGEIFVASPGVMKGYLNNAAETARVLQNGWYRTGDRGVLDSDGQLAVFGRLDEKILTGYHRIDPNAIEDVMFGHPDVALAAAVGVPDDVLGQRIKAFVVLRPGSKIDEGVLRAWLSGRMPEWMVPDLIEFRPSLPLTPTGKVARAVLRGG